MALADLEGFYREAKNTTMKMKPSPSARSYVVKLQGGDEYFREMWRKRRHHHVAKPVNP